MFTTVSGSADNPLLSSWTRQFGVGNYGAQVTLNGSTAQLAYTVGSLNRVGQFNYLTPYGLVLNKWYHFATSVKYLSSGSYRRRIYINSNLVYELTGNLVAIGSGYEQQQGLCIGGGWISDISRVAQPGRWTRLPTGRAS
jgi:hypothetical protein